MPSVSADCIIHYYTCCGCRRVINAINESMTFDFNLGGAKTDCDDSVFAVDGVSFADISNHSTIKVGR